MGIEIHLDPDLQACLMERDRNVEGPNRGLMSLNTVQEIERAIGTLTPPQLEELYAWLDQNCPQPIDTHLQTDLAAGRLDNAIQRALDDEKSGRIQPL